MMDPKKHITWDESVEHIMKATGKNRRQATAALTEACRQGKLPAFTEVDGEIEQIPQEQFPKIN